MGCPGSASYRIDGNGLVEVNGLLPTISNAATKQQMADLWGEYGRNIESAARHFGVNPFWLFGIMMVETGWSYPNLKRCSPCSACSPKYCRHYFGKSCCAWSIMQIIEPTANKFGYTIPQIQSDDATAITAGAHIFKYFLDKAGGDLVKAAAFYNGGTGVPCTGQFTFGYRTQGDYPMAVVRYANTAAMMGLPRHKSLLAGVFVAAGVTAAGLILADVWKPKWI